MGSISIAKGLDQAWAYFEAHGCPEVGPDRQMGQDFTSSSPGQYMYDSFFFDYWSANWRLRAKKKNKKTAASIHPQKEVTLNDSNLYIMTVTMNRNDQAKSIDQVLIRRLVFISIFLWKTFFLFFWQAGIRPNFEKRGPFFLQIFAFFFFF